MWRTVESPPASMEEGVECEPPPDFRMPPPPRPPFLQEADCSENALPDFETCDAVPVIDAEFHSSPALPSAAVIAVCSVVLLLMVLLASALVWKNKRKMQNLLPCKTSPQNDVSGAVIYEDLTNIHPRPNPPSSIEMSDVKFETAGQASVFICPPPRNDPYNVQDLYNPVYEELSNGSEGRSDSEEGGVVGAVSEDEFAEDELSLAGDVAPSAPAPPSRLRHEAPTSGTSSLQGSTGNDLCRDLDSSDERSKLSETDSFLALRMNNRNMSLPPKSRELPPPPPTNPRERRPRSLDRRRRNSPRNRPAKPASSPPPAGLEPAAFHEGLIMDVLGPFQRGLVMGRRAPQPAYHLPYSSYVMRHVSPYESVSVLGLSQRPELTSFRPPAPPPKNSSSQDSFNSDSGFSNHTASGGRAGRGREMYDNMRPLPPLLT